MTARGAGLALVAVGIGTAACAALGLGDTRAEVVRRLLESMVQIRTEREGGARRAASGIVLTSTEKPARTFILTARHVLDPPGRQQILVTAPRRKNALPATLVAASPDIDAAVLEVLGVSLPGVRLKEVVQLGDEVWVVAFPWGRRLTLVSGVVSQIAAEDGEVPVVGSPRMVDASVSYGSSGGGVFDLGSGALVGIVEGYRTARLTLPESQGRSLDLPVAGETTVVSVQSVVRFLTASGLGHLVSGQH